MNNKPRLFLLLAIVLTSVLLPVGSISFLLWLDSSRSVENLTITNVTGTSATVTWMSEDRYVGKVYYKEAGAEWTPVIGQRNTAVVYDDRDVELDADGNYVQRPEGLQERYTHHVTLRDLKPSTKYSIRIGGYLDGKQIATQVETGTVAAELNTPDPAYGKVIGITPGDTVVFWQVGSTEDLKILSTTTAINSTYTFDLNALPENLVISTDVAAAIWNQDQLSEALSYASDSYKPLDDLVLAQISDSSQDQQLLMRASAEQGPPHEIAPLTNNFKPKQVPGDRGLGSWKPVHPQASDKKKLIPKKPDIKQEKITMRRFVVTKDLGSWKPAADATACKGHVNKSSDGTQFFATPFLLGCQPPAANIACEQTQVEVKDYEQARKLHLEGFVGGGCADLSLADLIIMRPSHIQPVLNGVSPALFGPLQLLGPLPQSANGSVRAIYNGDFKELKFKLPSWAKEFENIKLTEAKAASKDELKVGGKTFEIQTYKFLNFYAELDKLTEQHQKLVERYKHIVKHIKVKRPATNKNALTPTVVSPVRAESAAGELTVKESGTYALFAGGEKVAEEKVLVVDDEVQIVPYFDDNANGSYDEGEETGEELLSYRLEQSSEMETYELNAGWNLLNLTLVGEDGAVNASDLLAGWRAEGAEILHIVKYEAGKFVFYSDREGENTFSEDFAVKPGEALFVFNAGENSVVSFAGRAFAEGVDLRLNNGWNLVGVVSPQQEYTAASLLTKAKGAGIDAQIVSGFDNGSYTSLIQRDAQTFGNDFNLIAKRGYFIRVEDGGNLLDF